MAVAMQASGLDQGAGGEGENGPGAEPFGVSMGCGVRTISGKSSCPRDVHRARVLPGESAFWLRSYFCFLGLYAPSTHLCTGPALPPCSTQS